MPVLAAWRRGYEVVQPVASRVSARLPIATLDACLLVVVAALAWLVWSRRLALVRPLPLLVGVAAVATGWLVFLMAWGWHYQVPTVEQRLGLTPAELTAERGEAFAAGIVAHSSASWPA